MKRFSKYKKSCAIYGAYIKQTSLISEQFEVNGLSLQFSMCTVLLYQTRCLVLINGGYDNGVSLGWKWFNLIQAIIYCVNNNIFLSVYVVT